MKKIVFLLLAIICFIFILLFRYQILFSYYEIENNSSEYLIRINKFNGKTEILNIESLKWTNSVDLDKLKIETEMKETTYRINDFEDKIMYLKESLKNGEPIKPLRYEYFVMERTNQEFNSYTNKKIKEYEEELKKLLIKKKSFEN